MKERLQVLEERGPDDLCGRMMDTQPYWDESSAHSMQVKYEGLDGRYCKDDIYRMGIGAGCCEGNLNFATASEDDENYSTKKKVSRQDPMSHRIIEKRRRDRMNNCLADLSRLIPVDYLKKGRGRIEKTEIIEMAIRHMKYLQDSHTDVKPQQQQQRQQHQQQQSTLVQHGMHAEDSVDSVTHTTSSQLSASAAAEHYRLGYQECVSETMNFLVEVEGCYARDSLCVQLISHLQQHCDKILGTNGSGDASSNSSASNSFSLGSSKPSAPCLPIVNHNNNNSHTQNNNNNNSDNQQASSLSCSFDSGDSCHHLHSSGQLQQQSSFASDDSNHSSHSFDSPQQQQLQQRPTTYKFKNSIKQRFSADQRVKSTDSCSASPPPSASVSSSSSECKSPQQSSPQPQTHQGVPIFALHDNGGYYVPLTLEASVLRPHLGCCQPHQTTGCSAEAGVQEAVLHPVTISVNFSHPSSAPSWTPAHSPSPSQMSLHYEHRQQ